VTFCCGKGCAQEESVLATTSVHDEEVITGAYRSSLPYDVDDDDDDNDIEGMFI